MSQKRAGVILTYLTQAVHLITGLVYTPIMLRLLGQSEYGLYQLVNSVVGYLGLLSFGFSSSYLRFYSRFRALEDEDGVRGLNGMFMTVFLSIAAVSVICGCVMVTNIRFIFATGLTEAEYPTATILMALMVANLAISFPNSVFTCWTSAQESFVFQRGLNLVSALLSPLVTLPLLLMGHGSVAMVLVSTCLTVASLSANAWYCLRRLGMRFRFRYLDWKLFGEVFAFTFFIFLNQVIDQINWNVDRFLLGRMSGTAAVAAYAVGMQVNSIYTSLSTAISSVFAPQVNMVVARGGESSDDELTDVMVRVGKVQFLILAGVLTGFIFLGRPFVLLWGGSEYGESWVVAMVVMVPMLVPLIQNVGIEIQRAKNRHQVRSVVYFLIAVLNVVVSIPLIRAFGPIGGAIGTALGLTLGNILFMNWYYSWGLGLGMGRFWASIARMLLGLVIPCAFGIILALFVPIDGWGTLLGCGLIYAIVYATSMWLLGMDEGERDAVREPVLRALGRTNHGGRT